MTAVTWLIMGLIAGWCVLYSLYVVAKRAERERAIIDLKLQVAALREQYAEHLQDIAKREAEKQSARHTPPAPAHASHAA